MEPFEFVALTPKSNCGDCGYPSCLAFAVSVTRGGVTPGLCPHLEITSLPEEVSSQQTGEGLSVVAQGQKLRDLALVAHLKSKIAELDFKILAPVLGAALSDGGIEQLIFLYLGRHVMLGKDSVSLEGEDLLDPRDQILLYNYVAFGGGRPPDGNWVGMESLPNSISKIRTLETYCEKKLVDIFRGRATRLMEICCRIGGNAVMEDQSASVSVILPVLPHLPLLLLFWEEEPEDGFDAKVKILFDHHVLDFLDLESLVFAAERMAECLINLDS